MGGRHLNDPQVRIVESDEDLLLYEMGHIPGAVKLDWHTDLQDQLRPRLRGQGAFEQLMCRHGITNDTTVVFYGDRNNWYAAYSFWLFQLYGHRDAALDERRAREVGAEGRPYTQEVPSYPATDVHGPGAEPRHPRLPRPGGALLPRMQAGRRRWWTCARPPSTPAS